MPSAACSRAERALALAAWTRAGGLERRRRRGHRAGSGVWCPRGPVPGVPGPDGAGAGRWGRGGAAGDGGGGAVVVVGLPSPLEWLSRRGSVGWRDGSGLAGPSSSASELCCSPALRRVSGSTPSLPSPVLTETHREQDTSLKAWRTSAAVGSGDRPACSHWLRQLEGNGVLRPLGCVRPLVPSGCAALRAGRPLRPGTQAVSTVETGAASGVLAVVEADCCSTRRSSSVGSEG